MDPYYGNLNLSSLTTTQSFVLDAQAALRLHVLLHGIDKASRVQADEGIGFRLQGLGFRV